jgi:Ca-activated chloride channel family protein
VPARWPWLVSAFCVAVVTLTAQQTLPVFKSAIELTTVTATVVSREGQLVTGLSREAFDLYEDGELQTITQFTNERVPVSLGILLDVSDSMYGQRIQDARTAIERFVGDVLAQGDEFAILAFNHQQQLLTSWTSDATVAPRVLEPLRPFGSTAIYDALIAALPLVDTRNRQRAALLVVSDGADTASDAALRDVRAGLLRSDAFVYAIAIDTPGRRPINAPINPAALAEVTDQSGGRTSVVRSSADLSAALEGIAAELNSQYLIGYSSPHAADGRYHSIRVRVRGTDHRVRARNGYIAEPHRQGRLERK